MKRFDALDYSFPLAPMFPESRVKLTCYDFSTDLFGVIFFVFIVGDAAREHSRVMQWVRLQVVSLLFYASMSSFLGSPIR